MQKLIRRSPSVPILCSSANPSPWGLNINKSENNSYNKNNGDTVSSTPFNPSYFWRRPTMPISSAFHLRLSPATSLPRKPTSASAATARVAPNSLGCICPCSLDSGTPARAWVVFKEGRSAFGSAWFHTKTEGRLPVVVAESSKSSENSGSRVDGGSDGGGTEASSVDGESRPLRFQRRQKGSSSSASDQLGNPDLLAIPGVGPRNLRKLVDKGIAGVAELKQLYRDKFFGKSSQKMVDFLQSSVGIIHKNHAESITSYIKESMDEELKEKCLNLDGKPAQKKRLTFCVEGNISVGKTTFLQRIANETLELRDLVEIVPEPISKWQDVGPDHLNILDAFYAEPQRYAYTFQNYVFVTRVMQERESAGGVKPLRLMERSIFSDRMVFVRAVHEANWMNEMEINIYDSWFDPVVSCLPGLIPDGFIYLRASPDTCHKRMLVRKRAEEGGVTLDYLRGLHEKHENWLFPSQSGNHGVLSVSQLPHHIDSSLHPVIKDRIFYLEGDHMHSSIQKVPALVLDCEPNIDFSKDTEAKRQYARQVAEFFEFVKKKKEVPSSKPGDNAKNSSQQVLLPHTRGLWVPDEGKHIPESASLDFRRAMSTFVSA